VDPRDKGPERGDVAQPNARDEASREAIAARLERRMRCAKPNCACKAEPPKLHGPYHQWTRKIENKTFTVNLTDDQHERYAAWFVEAQRLRTLLSDLEELSLQIASRGEHFGPRKSR